MGLCQFGGGISNAFKIQQDTSTCKNSLYALFKIMSPLFRPLCRADRCATGIQAKDPAYDAEMVGTGAGDSTVPNFVPSAGLDAFISTPIVRTGSLMNISTYNSEQVPLSY